MVLENLMPFSTEAYNEEAVQMSLEEYDKI